MTNEEQPILGDVEIKEESIESQVYGKRSSGTYTPSLSSEFAFKDKLEA